MAALGMQREHTSLKSAPVMSRGYPSLFLPDSDDELSSDSGSEGEYQQSQPAHLPMHEVIADAPKTLTSLLESLLPRLQPSADVKGVSLQDQKSLTDVLVGELASQFSVIQRQIDDPFLNPSQNKELHRRVVVRVCEILEQLYKQFLVKAAASHGHGVFSATANFSRVRAELTLEANKRLNIPLIRREVLAQIRGVLPSIDGDSPCGHVTVRKRIKQTRLPPIPKQEVKKRMARKMNLDDLNLGEPLENKMVGFGVRLESGAVRRRINKLYSRVPDPVQEEVDEGEISTWDKTSSQPDISKSPVDQPSSAPQLHRVWSMPELWGAFLLCDMGLTSRTDRPSDKRGEEGLLGIHRPPSVGKFMDLKLIGESGDSSNTVLKQLEDYTAQDLSRDLQDLCVPSPNQDASGVDELHPLLQAHGHGLSVRAARRLAQYEAELRRDQESTAEEERETEEMESRIPSVATLDQLPYLNIDHVEGPLSSSHPSLYVKSGPSLDDSYGSSTSGLPGQSSQLTDLGESIGRSSQSGLRLADTTLMLLPDDPDFTMGLGSACQLDESNSRSRIVSARGHSVMEGERSGGESVWESSVGLMEALPVTQEPQDDPTPRPPSPAPHEQSAAITTRLENGGVIRTIDVQVSERTPLNELRLKLFGPIYNQITGELDSSMMAELDSSLHEGKEIREVYQEIMKTLSTSHLQFTHEPTLEPAIDVPVDLSHILASNTLHHRRSRRVVNRELYRPIPHPWGEGVARKDWEKSNQYQGPDLEQYGITPGAGVPLSPRLAHISRAYNTWANWWSSTANPEDYLKYTSREESDYLRLVYHLYDSEGSDSEAEEEARLKRERLELLRKKLQAKETRRRQRYSAKSRFETGVWNINTVMMGGLGGDPDCSSDDEEVESSITDQEQMVTHEEAQERLSNIWQRLHFPHSLQMDMAIKYSNPRQSTQLGKVLSLWEEVCVLIEKREALMTGLEAFEREASDPSRFFSKGNRGSSSTRLREARKRDSLHKELDSLDKQVSRIVQRLLTQYGDTVTYKGRPYCDKMSSDRTEMLYWLQQERRAAVLKPASVVLSMNPPHSVVTVPTQSVHS